jgi:hypothetical protein
MNIFIRSHRISLLAAIILIALVMLFVVFLSVGALTVRSEQLRNVNCPIGGNSPLCPNTTIYGVVLGPGNTPIEGAIVQLDVISGTNTIITTMITQTTKSGNFNYLLYLPSQSIAYKAQVTAAKPNHLFVPLSSPLEIYSGAKNQVIDPLILETTDFFVRISDQTNQALPGQGGGTPSSNPLIYTVEYSNLGNMIINNGIILDSWSPDLVFLGDDAWSAGLVTSTTSTSNKRAWRAPIIYPGEIFSFQIRFAVKDIISKQSLGVTNTITATSTQVEAVQTNNTDSDFNGYTLVSGTIEDQATGLPLSGAMVEFTDSSKRKFQQTVGDNGAYRFISTATKAIAPGEFSIQASRSGIYQSSFIRFAVLKAGQNLIYDLSLSPAANLSMTISSDPISNAAVVPGQFITYTLTFSNTGKLGAMKPHLDWSKSPGLQYVKTFGDLGPLMTFPEVMPAGAVYTQKVVVKTLPIVVYGLDEYMTVFRLGSSTLEADYPDNLAKIGHGLTIVKGFVYNKAHTPISGVNVQLIDSAGRVYFASTSPSGEYVFTSTADQPIAAGFGILSVSKNGYMPANFGTPIVSGRVSRIDITLIPWNP